MADVIRVGLIGAHPTRGWAAAAHLPALAQLPEYRLAAVATTRMDSAEETARRHGVPQAFDDWRRMIAEAPLDAVIVAVKVPHHREMVLHAIAAGKHVFCEWPLGLSAAEAEAMRAAAEARGVRHMVGLQSHAHPVLAAARRLVENGAIGPVISATLVASLGNWWPQVAASEAYRFDPAFGATGLTVPGGHTLDAFLAVLGPFATFRAVLAAPHGEAVFTDTGERRAITAPTQLALAGRLANGAVASLHVKPDIRTPGGIRFEINGARGDLLITTAPPVGPAPVGIQRAELVLEAALGDARAFTACDVPDPEAAALAAVPAGAPRHTARLLRRFAAAIHTGSPATPDFATACDRHRLIEAIVASARAEHDASARAEHEASR
jgi:predicted dehydrogenase